MGKFKAALDSGKFRAKVEADAAAGAAVGANGTPTFFINGRELVGAQPFDAFKAVIDEEIAKADKLLASGTKPADLYAKLIEEGVKSNAPRPRPGAGRAAAVQNVEVGNAPVTWPEERPGHHRGLLRLRVPVLRPRACPRSSRSRTSTRARSGSPSSTSRCPSTPNAKPAAAASLAAHEQGKFWEYHDKLFANQRALDRASLEKYAQELGLDMGKFKAALDSQQVRRRRSPRTSNEGTRVGANGTPTFFINGRQLVGAQPVDAFKRIIDEELKKKGAVAGDQK